MQPHVRGAGPEAGIEFTWIWTPMRATDGFRRMATACATRCWATCWQRAQVHAGGRHASACAAGRRTAVPHRGDRHRRGHAGRPAAPRVRQVLPDRRAGAQQGRRPGPHHRPRRGRGARRHHLRGRARRARAPRSASTADDAGADGRGRACATGGAANERRRSWTPSSSEAARPACPPRCGSAATAQRLLFDAGEPRNEPAWAVHGYPGLVIPTPSELRRRLYSRRWARAPRRHAGRSWRIEGQQGRVHRARTDGTESTPAASSWPTACATTCPDIEGLDELYGTSVFHCPTATAPPFADTPIGVIGWDRYGANLALYLRHWTPRRHAAARTATTLDLDEEQRGVVQANGIAIVARTAARVTGHGGNLTQAEFDDGDALRLDALFFHLGSEPRCELANSWLRARRRRLRGRGSGPGDVGARRVTPPATSPARRTWPRSRRRRASAPALAIHRSLLPDSRRV
jgi:thioredoxin reductase